MQILHVNLLILLTLTARLGWCQADRAPRSVASCTWLAPASPACDGVTSPVLALIFLHMRKAGGTRVRDFITEWAGTRQCLTKNISLHQYHNAGAHSIDIQQGVKFPCPYFDMYENEYDFIPAGTLMDTGFGRLGASGAGAVLTSLRHPIDRIGSQAFFKTGVGKHTVFELVIIDAVRERCGENGVKVMQLSAIRDQALFRCVADARAAGMDRVRLNATLWREWMGEVTFHDNYMPNYYLRRLQGQMRHLSKGTVVKQNMTDIINNVNMCALHMPLNRCTFSQLEHLSSSLPAQYRADFNASEFLEPAKVFLRDYVHVLVSEEMDSPRATAVLQAALHDSGFVSRHTAHSNPGMLRGAAVDKGQGRNDSYYHGYANYCDMMPPAILDRMVRENTEDIELYHFARKLFFERTS